MLSIGWLIAAVLVALVLAGVITSWITFTLTRLDRLHARVDAAQAALDAQLVRRAVALLRVAELPGPPLGPTRARELAGIAERAMAADLGAPAGGDTPADRRTAENRVSRAISELSDVRDHLPGPAVSELSEAVDRVLIARRFFNSAVRDTRTLRARWMPRLLHLSGHRSLPQYFDIEDSNLFEESDINTAPRSTT